MARELWRQIGRVTADLPRFLTAPLYRSWHLRWGATDAEVAAAMPGDDLLPRAQFNPTRAITIDAPPAAVWPWLVQVGFGRAGFYSDGLLDNFARPSLREIDPDLQKLEVGQWVSMSSTPSESTAWKVDGLVPNEWLLWRKPDSTWSWVLRDLGGGRTRLVTRVHVLYDWSRPACGAFGVVLMEFGGLSHDAANAPGHQTACGGHAPSGRALIRCHLEATMSVTGGTAGRIPRLGAAAAGACAALAVYARWGRPRLLTWGCHRGGGFPALAR